MARRVIYRHKLNHDRWLVSYADFLMLLLAFFVVMYSISQVNEGKYRTLSSTLMDAFNVPEMSLKPIQIGQRLKSSDPHVGISQDQAERPQNEEYVGNVPEEFKKISDRIEDAFAELIAKDLISVKGNEEWLEVELKSSLLFSSGRAEPSAAARQILGEIAGIVKDTNNPIRVEGFTDNKPITTESFPSNWELSAARASAIVKMMIGDGLNPAQLAVVGYGEYQPSASNETPEGRSANRRVVLMISQKNPLRPERSTMQPLATAATVVLPEKTVKKPAADTATKPATEFHTIEMEGGRVLFTNDPSRVQILQSDEAAQQAAKAAPEPTADKTAEQTVAPAVENQTKDTTITETGAD